MALMMEIALTLALTVSLAAGQPLKTLVFKEIPPATTAEFVLRTTTEATIDGVTSPISYKAILESGKTYPGFDGNPWAVGTVLDKFGAVITANESSIADPALARDFDFSSLFEKFGKIWMVTQNEDAFGSFFLMELSQNLTTGELTVAKGKTLNTGAVFGSIRPCSGSLTPWNSHLAGLEDAVDARTYPGASPPGQFLYQQLQLRLSNWSDVSPYWYGWFIEVQVTNAAGDASVVKHYTMGRAPWETGVVLPDQRTVICADDTSNGGIMVMFIADKPKDLSCGRLYTSKPIQLNAADGGSFSMEWVELTNGTSICNSHIIPVLGTKWSESIKFSDMFDYLAPVMVGGVPDLSQKPSDYYEVKSVGSRYEWLRLKPGMRNFAAVFETARLTSYFRACTEWTKLEGVTYDWRTREVYFALTSIKTSMLDGSSNDVGGPNLIRLPQNIPGAVYKMKTAPVNGLSWYTPISARVAINSWGAPSVGSGNNTVPQGSIASPDNVGFLPRYRTIFIGEDCDTQHISNYGWAYNVDTGAITRVISTPYDAEVTSPYYFPNVGAFSYLTATVQHPRVADMPATVGAWALPKEQ